MDFEPVLGTDYSRFLGVGFFLLQQYYNILKATNFQGVRTRNLGKWTWQTSFWAYPSQSFGSRLEELKQDKLKVEQWADKSVTAAAVFNTVSKTLFETLPYPTYENDDIEMKTQLVYEHLKHQYFGGGMSIKI